MAWQILKVAEAIERDGGRVTLGMLGDLVRGSGGGSYGVAGGGRRGKGRGKEKVGLDLEDIAGGKVKLSKDVSQFQSPPRVCAVIFRPESPEPWLYYG